MLVAFDYERNTECSLFYAVVSEFYINLGFLGHHNDVIA
jgi:hypothetical protein